MAFLKFSRDVGAWQANSVQEVDDELAPTFVRLGQAQSVPIGEYMRASVTSEREALRADIVNSVQETVRAAIAGRNGAGHGTANGTANGTGTGSGTPASAPPSGGGGVDFGRIADGPASEEREVG